VLNFNGEASISYTINDNLNAVSNIATVTITVVSVNDAPVANDDTTVTDEDTPITIEVLANDNDVDGTLIGTTVDLNTGLGGFQDSRTTPEGSWSVDSDGVVTFSPLEDFNGTAILTYRVNDNQGLSSNIATITVTVNPVNDAPVATDDNTATNEDTPVTFNVTSNDTDVDGSINLRTVDLDPATVGIQNTFSNEFGTWSVDASGDVTYTPDLNYNGTASVTYRVNDNNGLTSNTATVTVTVNPVNDAPVAIDDDASTDEDTPVAFNVTSNDTDVDGSINAATVDLDPATAGIQNSFSNEFGTWSVD